MWSVKDTILILCAITTTACLVFIVWQIGEVKMAVQKALPPISSVLPSNPQSQFFKDLKREMETKPQR